MQCRECRHGMVRGRRILKTPELETTHQKADKHMQPLELGKINLRVAKRAINRYSTYLNHTIYWKLGCDMDLQTKEERPGCKAC